MSNVDHDTQELAEKYDAISDPQYEGGVKLVDMLGIGEGDRVLDLGCGTGRLAFYTARKVGPTGKVVGIDPAPLRIEIAKKKLAEEGLPNVEFGVGGSDDLKDFSGGQFDAAYLSAVFHWIDDKDTAARQLFRVLKPGGRIGIGMEDREHISPIEMAMYRLLDREPYASKFGNIDDIRKALGQIRKASSRKEIGQILGAAGFQDIDIRTYTTTMTWATPAEFLEFMDASSFGSFRKYLPGPMMADIKKDMEAELEKMKTSRGLENTSNKLVVTATKP